MIILELDSPDASNKSPATNQTTCYLIAGIG